MEEIWKDVVGFEGYYKVSNLGNVMSLAGGKRSGIMKQRIRKDGYKDIQLYDRDLKKSFAHQVHRLVAEAFIPKVEGKWQVNHIDGNKTNNHVSNLEWVTARENTLHSIRTGLRTLTPQNGENNNASRMTWELVDWIREHYIKGDKEFGQWALSRKLGVSQSTIEYIVQNKTWVKRDDR